MRLFDTSYCDRFGIYKDLARRDFFPVLALIWLHRISRIFTEGTRRRWLVKEEDIKNNSTDCLVLLSFHI